MPLRRVLLFAWIFYFSFNAIDGEKVCRGSTLDSRNLESYSGCTRLNGSLEITNILFDGDAFEHIPPLTNYNLLSNLATIKEITGYLLIQLTGNSHTEIFSYLRNLEIISGKELHSRYALVVTGTGTRQLHLTSLKEVWGPIHIEGNSKMCYVNTIGWQSLLKGPAMRAPNSVTVVNNGANCPECHAQCAGCWGPGNQLCQRCRNSKQGDHCVATCDLTSYFVQGTECLPCHEECADGCDGVDANQCKLGRCKNFKDKGFCVNTCPSDVGNMKYHDRAKECQPCHALCSDGCTGPNGNVGVGGCNTCERARAVQNSTAVTELFECLDPDDKHCPSDHYLSGYFGDYEPMKYKEVCIQCHPVCSNCFGFGQIMCTTCRYFRQLSGNRGGGGGEGETHNLEHIMCVQHCEKNSFVDNIQGENVCHPCHSDCATCKGPTSTDCKTCKGMGMWMTMDNGDRKCVATCPSEKPFQQVNAKNETECVGNDSKHERERLLKLILGPTIPILVLILCAIIGVCCYRKHVAEKKRLAMYTFSDEEDAQTHESGIKPVMSKLKIIPQQELKFLDEIGSGSLGTVFKGEWLPPVDNIRIPVALKRLHDSSPARNKEMLEAAKIMASVDHPNCLRFIGVCMADNLVLVTQLHRLGSLITYLRRPDSPTKIAPKSLLLWCKQIARGMAYLEYRKIVHRDLAARSILRRSENSVCISDFGLANILDQDDKECKASGGKLRSKWHAPECLKDRVFTHKSDVWAYGVTCWEVLTYGKAPYDKISSRDLATHLEKGKRLEQPDICTQDVYKVLTKCWMLDPNSRPTFTELKDEFGQMAKDPSRYVKTKYDESPAIQQPSSLRPTLSDDNEEVDASGRRKMDADDYFKMKDGKLEPAGEHETDNQNAHQSTRPSLRAKKEHASAAASLENQIPFADSDSDLDEEPLRQQELRPLQPASASTRNPLSAGRNEQTPARGAQQGKPSKHFSDTVL